MVETDDKYARRSQSCKGATADLAKDSHGPQVELQAAARRQPLLKQVTSQGRSGLVGPWSRGSLGFPLSAFLQSRHRR